jgi:hypothetical protein
MAEETKPVLSFKVSTQKSEDVSTASIKVDDPDPTLSERANKSFEDIQSRFSSSNVKKFVWAIPLVLLLGAIGAGYHFEVHKKAKETLDHVMASRLPKEDKTPPAVKSEAPGPIVEDKEPVRAKVGVLEVRDYYLRIQKEDGSVEVRTGGSRSWRLNNPCTILYGKFSVSAGAIGRAEKFSVFETYPEGRKACFELLFESDHGYKDKSIEDAIKRFAPASEGFKTNEYLKGVRVIGVPLTTKMSELSEARKNKLIDILMDLEDFIPGKVIKFESLGDFKKRGY